MMNEIINVLSCLMALAASFFLWKTPLTFFKETLLIILCLLTFILYSFFSQDLSLPWVENLPFRMLALCLCFSTTSLNRNKRLCLVLTQIFWFWIEFFGAISLLYRNFDVPWLRILAIGFVALGSIFLSKINRETEFVLMIYWIAIWMFF